MSTATPEPHQERGFRLDPKVWGEMMRHPGKWVVVSESKLIAVGDDPTELVEIARAQGIEAPLLDRVPEPDVGLLV